MPTLVFRLRGPLAAWGEQSIGSERQTLDLPGKSHIVGLLAAALGIDRHDVHAQQGIADDIDIAVAGRHAGVLRDYHTTKVHKRTMLGNRYYLQDADCVIAVTSQNGRLDAYRDALLAPKWMLFLGRKSCPVSTPLQPVIRPETGQAAITAYIEAHCQDPRLTGALTYEETGHGDGATVERYDDPAGLRRFERRPVTQRIVEVD